MSRFVAGHGNVSLARGPSPKDEKKNQLQRVKKCSRATQFTGFPLAQLYPHSKYQKAIHPEKQQQNTPHCCSSYHGSWGLARDHVFVSIGCHFNGLTTTFLDVGAIINGDVVSTGARHGSGDVRSDSSSSSSALVSPSLNKYCNGGNCDDNNDDGHTDANTNCGALGQTAATPNRCTLFISLPGLILARG